MRRCVLPFSFFKDFFDPSLKTGALKCKLARDALRSAGQLIAKAICTAMIFSGGEVVIDRGEKL